MNNAQKIIDSIDELSATIRRMQQRQPSVQYSFGSMWAAAKIAKEAAKEMEGLLEAIGAGGVESLRKGGCLMEIQEPEQSAQAAPQGVQAAEPFAVLTREIGESSWWDHKPVKPDSVLHLHAKKDPHYDYVELYAHPTQQGLDAQVLMGYMHPGVFTRQQQSRWKTGAPCALRLNGWTGEPLQVPVYAKKTDVEAALAAQAKQGGV